MKKNISVLAFIFFVSIACAGFNVSPAAQSSGTTYRYDSLPDANLKSGAVEFRAASQWGKTDITYYFVNGTEKISGSDERQLVSGAFALWATETSLTFTEVLSPTGADILIGWARNEHGDGDSFDGPGDVLAHASYPNPYEDRQVFLHFDDDERWVNSKTQDVDLLTVAAHEIGHNLGLDHSDDPDALMYPSYSEPRRFLGQDDIAGVQSLYGLASAAPSAPQQPQPNENPPQSPDKDSDADGLADSDETLVTGTDPNKSDSDNDGLGDGVEVVNRMNPLDADMDKDGASDGQEISAGTNPFLPDQDNNISPELAQEVEDFLTKAIELQIKAYRESDASAAETIMAGDVLDTLRREIDSLNQQDLVEIAEIDYYNSYIDNIRIVTAAKIEADTCEVWQTQYYRRSDGALIQNADAQLIPQTITIQKINGSWFITTVEFYDVPAFCK